MTASSDLSDIWREIQSVQIPKESFDSSSSKSQNYVPTALPGNVQRVKTTYESNLLRRLLPIPSEFREERRKRLQAVTAAEQSRNEIILQGMAQLHPLVQALKKKRKKLAAMKSEGEGLRSLIASHKELSLDTYLKRHPVSGASFTGVSGGLKKQLDSYGIRTAVDVTEKRISRIPGFGDGRVEILLRWRKSLENSYRTSHRMAPVRYAKIIKNLQIGLTELKTLATEAMGDRSHWARKLKDAERRVAQVKADASIV